VFAKDQTATRARTACGTVAAGAWSRTPDADAWDDLVGGCVWVDDRHRELGHSVGDRPDAGGTIDIDPVALQLVYRAAASLADLDPTLLSTATPASSDYLVGEDVSAGGALRRFLISALPFLGTSTVHNDLSGRSDVAAHPQYLPKAGGTMTGALDMGSQRIEALPAQDDDTAGTDAASVAYVRTKIANAQGRRPGDVFIHAGSTCPLRRLPLQRRPGGARRRARPVRRDRRGVGRRRRRDDVQAARRARQGHHRHRHRPLLRGDGPRGR
jgi:hypothetical protein